MTTTLDVSGIRVNGAPADGAPVEDAPNRLASRLEARLARRAARVGVVGLGYVGLPLALAFHEAGFAVRGIDVDERVVDGLRHGRSHITDVPDADVAAAVAEGGFVPSLGGAGLAALDVVVICVPTPLRKTKDPDLTHVIAATESVADRVGKGTLVVLESTTYPGTTEEVVRPRLEARGFEVGHDLFLAFSPERVDPGNREYRTRTIPKIVGGVGPLCGRLAAALYGQCVDRVVSVSSTKVAEMVKLLENTFRSVNVALANEMALLCKRMGIDVWEVIDAAATKPFGFMPFYPGPGLGGHCIPIDPILLQWKARAAGFDPRFTDLADRINESMPEFVVRCVTEMLNDVGKPVRGARVHVLGVTYKRDVSDTRESPALRIIGRLFQRGARVSYSDPFVPELAVGDDTFEAREPDPGLLRESDIVVVVTDHSAFDYHSVVAHAPLVFDTRNATRGIEAGHVERI